MLEVLSKALPKPLIRHLVKARADMVEPCYQSYSQEGEDLILRRIFEGRRHGFYVDVGAHHPKRFSNTYLFYKEGWSGINIDAMPGSMATFKRVRPRDINVEAAIAQERRELEFFIFSDPALSTFDEELARHRDGQGVFGVVAKRRIMTTTLADILRTHLPTGQRIDFLNVDVEGLDLEVLQSNDWTHIRPECILVESGSSSVEETFDSEVFQYLARKQYSLAAKTVTTLIFRTRVELPEV